LTRIVRLFSTALLVISARAFAAVIYVANDSDWAPLTIPLPGPGLTIDEVFYVNTSGEFRFECRVPISVVGDGLHLPDFPPIACDLVAQILPRGGVRRTAQIRSFDYSGRGSTELYSSKPVIELQRGTYELKLLNRGAVQPFGQSGALVTLTRFVHPTEAYLQGVLLRGIGWCALAAGLLSMGIAEVLSRRADPAAN
jgi:hypothetical protein